MILRKYFGLLNSMKLLKTIRFLKMEYIHIAVADENETLEQKVRCYDLK